MRKKAKVFLELAFEYEDPFDASPEWVRNDLEAEIGCCSNRYDIEKCEVVSCEDAAENKRSQILKLMVERAMYE